MTAEGRPNEGSLRSRLSYEPQELRFGTSGRRGDVVDLTQLEIYVNTLAELEYLQTLSPPEGGIVRGDVFYYAYDLRPSSSRFVPEEQGRGEIAQVIEQAVRDAGMMPVNLGRIPTPALTYYALGHGKGSIMVTGSHIPFDRNGYKTNTSIGELLKGHEAPVNRQVEQVRRRVYAQAYKESLFNDQGMFNAGHKELQPEIDVAGRAYLRRYADFFPGKTLGGKRILVYQHSAVGRDLIVEILRDFGAEVIPAGRSESFVPIDTENVDKDILATIQRLADEAAAQYGSLDAVVSTDGDSDRPLVLGLEPAEGPVGKQRVHFFGGDLLGMIVAEFLEADAVVVPITCNDGVDLGPLKDRLEPKTRIGSPYVVTGMERARRKGKRRVCGWEPNGGFLTGSDIEGNDRVLTALPTRDAVLPILAVLFSAVEQQVPLAELFRRLPLRFSRAALLKKIPRPISQKIVNRYTPADSRIVEARFQEDEIRCYDAALSDIEVSSAEGIQIPRIRKELQGFFQPADEFGEIVKLNWIDGIRVYFSNGDVTHFRPSGNADELRIYAVADNQPRADAIVRMGVAEPNGILRQLEKSISLSDPVAAVASSAGILVLQGTVQHYEWGGCQFIPSLLGIENRERKPYAELWIGVHPKAPSLVISGLDRILLRDLISRAPARILGEGVASRFKGQLPYLFKVLDARQMLSIQAHPDKRQAEEGFARENAAGVSFDDPSRNFKDDNHKPEAHVALTDLWMLHGFRPPEEIAEILEFVPEFRAILPDFRARLEQADGHRLARSEVLRNLYAKAMRMPQDQVDGILRPLLERLARTELMDKDNPDFWALRASREFSLATGHLDRGIFSIYLLNLVRLKPGEGTYQPAGLLHAYLEGTNIEIMANSDNVLRGGLTPKHVDVGELLRILRFEGGKPEKLAGQNVSATERVYRTSAHEFELSSISLNAHQSFQSALVHSADTMIILEGSVRLNAQDRSLELARGSVLLAPSGLDYRIEATSERAALYKASIPV